MIHINVPEKVTAEITLHKEQCVVNISASLCGMNDANLGKLCQGRSWFNRSS